MRGIIALAAVAALGSACTHQVLPQVSAARTLYSSYDEKIPGQFALLLDGSLRALDQQIRPSTASCGASYFPVVAGDVLAASTAQTMEEIFEDVWLREQPPPDWELRIRKMGGVVFVKLDEFEPRLRCAGGAFFPSCIATTELSLGIRVSGPDGTLLGASVSGDGRAEGDAGWLCRDAAEILAESIDEAIRETLERAAERVSNSERVREAARRSAASRE